MLHGGQGRRLRRYAAGNGTLQEVMGKARLLFACRAMTMVEIILSMAIIAVMASVATVAFHTTMDSSRLKHAGDRLLADLRQVRSWALRDQQSYVFQIDSGYRRYTVFKSDNEDNDENVIISVSLAEAPYHLSAMKLSFNPNDNERLVFDTRGNCASMGYIYLYNGSKTLTIRVTSEGAIEQIE